MRPSLVDTAGYQAQTIERVERLLELLIEIEGHPYLAPRLRLHGGTALNVFHLSMPRLSVDADLTYVGRIALDEYESERPVLETAITALATNLGYDVTTSGKVAHSGHTLKLRYRYGGQPDLIKVDLIYLNRAPLLAAETATCKACSPEVKVTTLALAELVAGKTKALFDRLAIRDLYDVHRIQSTGLPLEMAGGNDDLYRLHRRVRIYYTSLSKRFPCPIDESVAERFADRFEDIEGDLYPVLHMDDRPTLITMMASATRYLRDHVAPQEEEEREYLRLLDEESRYVPKLLFAPWREVLKRSEVSPAAAWKVANLKRRPAAPLVDYPEW
jgi:predicted nucleotidyltransferase component of viral defense system